MMRLPSVAAATLRLEENLRAALYIIQLFRRSTPKVIDEVLHQVSHLDTKLPSIKIICHNYGYIVTELTSCIVNG